MEKKPHQDSAEQINLPPTCLLGWLPPAVLLRITQFTSHHEYSDEELAADGEHNCGPRRRLTAASYKLFYQQSSIALSQTCNLFREFSSCFFEKREFVCVTVGMYVVKPNMQIYLKQDQTPAVTKLNMRVYLKQDQAPGSPLIHVPPSYWPVIQRLHITMLSRDPPKAQMASSSLFNWQRLSDHDKFTAVKHLTIRYEGLRHGGDHAMKAGPPSFHRLLSSWMCNCAWPGGLQLPLEIPDHKCFVLEAEHKVAVQTFPELQTIRIERDPLAGHGSVVKALAKPRPNAVTINNATPTANFTAELARFTAMLEARDVQFANDVRDEILARDAAAHDPKSCSR